MSSLGGEVYTKKIDDCIDTGREVDVRALNGKDVVFQKNVLADSVCFLKEMRKSAWI